MGNVLEKLFTYIPVALAVSLFLTSFRWIVFIFSADKLEKHLQPPTRRFISYHFPIFILSTVIFIIFILFTLYKFDFTVSDIIDNYTGKNKKYINELIIILIMAYLFIIFSVPAAIKIFRKSPKRLWYIIGENNTRVYIYKKTFNNKYFCYVVPNDSPEKYTCTLLSLEDMNYPTQVLYNKNAKNNLRQLWEDNVPSSKDSDIKLLNNSFDAFIFSQFFICIVAGAQWFAFHSVWFVVIIYILLAIVPITMQYPFLRAKLFRYVFKRRVRILKWRFKKWKKARYKIR
ncbi:hypothetical protein HCA84_02390 [Listeria booriae]|uniref:hypothetical protein n=1 Tax=Listeria booriae TaxID=1552123 RepID=UPI0016233A97|nr:hypothetical protein [Listeria booriae]MBC1893108.1 hypothetical protein [Listeria booriae]MBC1974513.1 hypothetical protein [Listeria booriae]MBC2031804.1 hypothetical protein [Listeria booriae]